MSFNSAMLEQTQAEGLDLDACIRVLTITDDAAVDEWDGRFFA